LEQPWLLDEGEDEGVPGYENYTNIELFEELKFFYRLRLKELSYQDTLKLDLIESSLQARLLEGKVTKSTGVSPMVEKEENN